MSTTDIDAILSRGNSRRRWFLLAGAAVVVAAVVVAVVLLTRPDEEDVVYEPERVEAITGRLSAQVDLSGSAISERSATLSFDVGGVVASVSVSEGSEVREGDSLASLGDAEAQRRVQTAEVQLELAQLRLEDLLADPEPAAIASANQSIVSARSQVVSAQQSLELLSEPPSASDLRSAEQAVATALRDTSSAEQALELLAEPPSAADLASAGQAVASALREISSAEQALDLLSEPPSASDLRSAEQAVATALRDISSSEQALEDLTDGATDAAISESRSAVMQAQVTFADAMRLEEEMSEVLTDASEEFCDRYSGLISSDDVIRSICQAVLPLSESQMDDLEESFEDRSATYESLGTALIDANLGFVSAHADRDSALSSLASAEETLDELLTPPSAEDLFQARQAIDAARASHASAVARLEDLQELASEEDLFQAERAIEAAKASHAAAVARLEDLQELASEEDVFQAEQALEAARASHAAAEARLEELRAATDEGEFERARAALESAQASLASAQAQYEELVAGASGNAVAQQRQDLRLAEISLEEARAALADLTLTAPFAGVVEAVNILPGDRVAAGFSAFTLYTSDRMLIELTVTEEELLDLEIGQTGTASFDAIEGMEYPVRLESIRRVPNAEQGVVTYDVAARILTGDDSDAAPAVAGGNARAGGGGGFRGGGIGGGFGGGASGGPFAGFQLPEGVSTEQVQQAIVSGEPLPEGVVLPPQVAQMIENLRASGQLARLAGESQPPAQRDGEQDASPEGEEQGGGTVELPLPAPGMSASVTILTEVRELAVLAPVSAVRQLDGRWFVSVQAPTEVEGETAFERAYVEIGETDGSQVEILNGVQAGTILLVGADNAGFAFSATLQQPQADPGFGGFGPGGGGGRR